MNRLALACLLATLAAPALAQTQEEVLQATLLPGWQMADGHRMAAVRLDLADHWKTYWRAPGETGIPPQFDWSGSTNLKSVRLHWPSPEVITLDGMQSIGYLHELVLPVEVVAIDPAKPVELRLQMDLGVCKDICMPAAVSLSALLAGVGTTDGAITASLANQPSTAVEAGLTQIGCAVSPNDDGLRLAATIGLPQQGDPETVVFETADATVWVAQATASRAGQVLTAETDLVPPNGAPFALDRSGVTVTVIGQGRSVEIKGCPAPRG
jgi:DsbC/DsbD-like thiol-disulfide interchange protein